MVGFVLVFDVVEDLDGFIHRGRLHDHFLEATLQSTVLLNVLAVLIQGGGTDALDLATCERGLEHVGSVQRAAGTAGTHNGVDLVDEQDDLGRLLEFVHDRFHTLLKLTAVLGAGHQGCDVQGYNALAEQHTRDFLLHDAQRQSLGNGRFTYTGFTDEDGVVLFAAREHLTHAFDFFLAADDGVEFGFLGHLGQVTAKVVQNRSLAFGITFLGTAAAATAPAR